GVILQIFWQAVGIELSGNVFSTLFDLIYPNFYLILLYILGVDAVCVSDYSGPPDFEILHVPIIGEAGRSGRGEVYCALDGVEYAGSSGHKAQVVEGFDGNS